MDGSNDENLNPPSSDVISSIEDMDAEETAEPQPATAVESIIATILTPGSSLNPTFLLIVDLVLALLLGTFLVLAILTRGNIHVLVLMGIELGLWASIKWSPILYSHVRTLKLIVAHRFVYELQKPEPPSDEASAPNEASDPDETSNPDEKKTQ